jgi:trans-aconitate methyltransferase
VSQRWDAEVYARNASFVAELGRPLLEMLAARAGERILDLGCGDGRLTRELAEAGCVVVGVDASENQVAAAREIGIDARVMSGEDLQFENEFEGVFSNAALHWMKQPARVLAGVHRALKPGGRFVGEFGAEGNVGAVRDALRTALQTRGIDYAKLDPWYFPSGDEYRHALQQAGFEVSALETFERPTTLPGDIVGWLDTFAGAFLAALAADDRQAIRGELRDALEPRLHRPDGTWWVDYVRLRFAARKPATSAG